MEKEEEKKKTKNSSKVLIIILTILLLAAISYIILDKTGVIDSITSSNKETKTKNTTEKTNTKSDDKSSTRQLTEAEKATITSSIVNTYNKYFASFYPLLNTNNITNQDLLMFAFYNTENKSSFTKKQVEDLIHKYFGQDRTVTHENIICPTENQPLYIYDASTETYTQNANHPGHGGGSTGIITDNKIYYLDGTITSNIVTIKAKVVYGYVLRDTNGPRNAYFKSFLDAKAASNPVIGDINSDNDITVSDTDIKNIADSLPTTTYTFEHDATGNYILKSVTTK